MKPRLLFVGRTRFRFPLDEPLQRRYDALSETVEWRQMGTGSSADPRFALAPELPLRALDGIGFYLALPFRVARGLRRFRPGAVLVQGAQETAVVLFARRVARVPTRVIFDVHGDWRTATRLYGSRLRRLLDPLADALARIGVRRADALRTVSGYTTSLVREQGREPAATFPAYMDLRPFCAEPPAPLPETPTALFVGVLERYKNVDGIAAAWRLAAPRVPEATLLLVGDGRVPEPFERLVADLPGRTEWVRRLPTPEVVTALDESWCLFLPSRSEGTPRVILEALCRGRAVIGGRVGGIPDAVHEGNGVLVDPEDHEAIADALVRILSDRGLAERLGAQALADSERWRYTPAEYAESVARLVERVT